MAVTRQKKLIVDGSYELVGLTANEEAVIASIDQIIASNQQFGSTTFVFTSDESTPVDTTFEVTTIVTATP